MRPIADLPDDEARGLHVLAFDLDDTLLDAGRLGEGAYASLFRLAEAGVGLLGVTGRPSALAEVLAGQWPVLGIVAENGAIACARLEEAGSRPRVAVLDPAADARAGRRAALADVVADLAASFPDLHPTDDVRGRLADFTFDIGERTFVPPERVQEARDRAHALGARTTRSSIHLHVTLDGHDKASGVVAFLSAHGGLDPTACRKRVAFIGDSENDEACFSAFSTTIAVANLRGRPTLAPRYVTRGARGEGFAEAAATIARGRGSQGAQRAVAGRPGR